ncbi:hypothetical protein RN001_000225 [Aquatica leii]|uniref:Uncharacterized protein n=1 Tax=Aquatica leii TaxID=1421715 RepID=A0AAN7Q2R6_9COLE|nr:hypothetical protein RN001_000225 [Aquatica leii]
MTDLKEECSGSPNYTIKIIVFVLVITLLQIAISLHSFSTIQDQTEIDIQRLLTYKKEVILETIQIHKTNKMLQNSYLFRKKRENEDDIKHICKTIESNCPIKGFPGIPGVRGLKGDPGDRGNHGSIGIPGERGPDSPFN